METTMTAATIAAQGRGITGRPKTSTRVNEDEGGDWTNDSA
jgi:hypothetical protein